jgi:AcrR family transcriptional regulator
VSVPVDQQPVDSTTRGRLLEAAAEVFCERGYDGTTVAEVARRAGLTTGAIYANFRDKAELLLKTIEQSSSHVVFDMEAAREAGVSAADRLLLMARRMVSEPDSVERLLFVEMFSAARRHPDVGRRVAEALAAMEGELARLMDRARNDGDLAPEWDAAVLARFSLALGVGFTHLAVAGLPDPDPAEWVALVGRLISSVRPAE